METKIIHPEQLNEAVIAIQEGALVSFPTETVYGLGADATNEGAVKNVYTAKGRPSDNPLIVHVASKEQVLDYVETISPNAQKLMDTFWPGPLTLIFKLKKESGLSKTVTGGLDTAAFRMPNNQLTLDLIKQSGKALVGPSANTSGRPSPTTAQHVFHDLSGKIFGILDGGVCQVGVESTVLDMSNSEASPIILRPGAVTKGQIESVIGAIEVNQHVLSEEEKPKAPGMKYKHYSPKTPVLMIDWEQENWQAAIDDYKQKNQRVGIMINDEMRTTLSHYDEYFSLSKTRNVKDAMHGLFAGLRFLDDISPDLDIIFVETYPEKDEGLAYMNRLKKASNQKIYLN